MNYIFFVFGLLCSITSFADTRDFIEQQRSILRDLESNSILPKNVINEMASVTIEVSSFFKKDRNATRKSAFSEPMRRRVILNRDAEFSGDLTVLAIHETLGAAGWLDVNYENSILAAVLLKDSKDSFLNANLRKSYQAQLYKIEKGRIGNYAINDGKLIDKANSNLDAKEESGVVLVGGGGDAKTAQIKTLIVEKFNRKLAFNPDYQRRNYRSIVFGLKIETVNNKFYKKRIRVKSTYNASKKYIERIFYVPSETTQEQAVRDIWFFSIYMGDHGMDKFVKDYYVPRDRLEYRDFAKDPSSFEPRGL